MSVVSLFQLIAGETGALITMAAALPTTAAAYVAMRRRRLNPVALLWTISLIAVAAEMFAAATGNREYVAGIGGEVVVFGLGLLSVFIAGSRRRWVAGGFLLLATVVVVTAQVSLNGWSGEIASDLTVVLAVLGTVMFLVIKVMESLAVSQSRFSDLASVIPVATFEFDIAELMSRLRVLAERPTDPITDQQYVELMRMVRLSYTNHTADGLAASFGTWRQFIAGPNLRQVRTMATSMMHGLRMAQESGAGEVTFLRSDGQHRGFIYQWALGRVAGRSTPDRLVLVATDVTRLRETERQLEKQLKERDQFVASVSHELRTPLTSIMGLTEELVNRPQDFAVEEQAELLEIVASETRDVVDIVEDLLVTARAEAGQLTVNIEQCDLGAEATRVAELLGDVAIAADSVWTHADSGRLRQVLRNLVSNAHRYGGDHVRVRVYQEADLAVAEVRDTGDRLPAEEQERIFKAYERATDGGAVGSVGLGLHVARLLARLMGGDLTYRHDGTEAIFRLELPVTPVSNVQLDVGPSRKVEEGGSPGDVAAFDQV